LLCSPLASGLFHKAISQSASVLLPNVAPANSKNRAFLLAKLLGKVTLFDIMKKVTFHIVQHLDIMPVHWQVDAMQVNLHFANHSDNQLN
jgi:carboxylesterase type B